MARILTRILGRRCAIVSTVSFILTLACYWLLLLRFRNLVSPLLTHSKHATGVTNFIDEQTSPCEGEHFSLRPIEVPFRAVEVVAKGDLLERICLFNAAIDRLRQEKWVKFKSVNVTTPWFELSTSGKDISTA